MKLRDAQSLIQNLVFQSLVSLVLVPIIWSFVSNLTQKRKNCSWTILKISRLQVLSLMIMFVFFSGCWTNTSKDRKEMKHSNLISSPLLSCFSRVLLSECSIPGPLTSPPPPEVSDMTCDCSVPSVTNHRSPSLILYLHYTQCVVLFMC